MKKFTIIDNFNDAKFDYSELELNGALFFLFALGLLLGLIIGLCA